MMVFFKRSRMAAAMLLAFVLAKGATAIYPDDHWTYATQLKQDTFDDFVKDAIDSGKTAFAPAWNDAVKAFAGNSNDVVFGDVNLSEEPIRGNYNPGAGGWPTIRYFNKETGPDGAPYEKKTSMSMCDELGPKHEYMIDYVEEAGNTSLCSVEDGAGCDDKSKTYLEKQKAKDDPDEWQKQMDRLEGLEGKEMKDDLKAWVKKRKKILRGLLARSTASQGEL